MSDHPLPRPSGLPPCAWDLLGIASLTAVVVVLVIRQSHLMLIPGQPERSHELGRDRLADFGDVIYYPLQAVRAGVNPYDCGSDPLPDGSPRYRQRYPVLNLFPLYSPLIFVLYWPWGYGDFVTSAAVYVTFNGGLLLALAYVCWHCAGLRPSVGQLSILATVMLATQAGRANFLGGETAIPLALGSIAAVTLAPHHPWLAGLALALTSFKPTFGLPLGILLLAARHHRTVVLGWGLGLVIGVAGMLAIFSRSGDLPRAREILARNQEVLESDPDVAAQSSARRVDTAGALERWSPIGGRLVQLSATLAVLGIASAALWRLSAARANPTASALTTSIVALGTVSSTYHLTYDALLLWAPIAVVLLAPASAWPGVAPRWRWCVACLLLVPMVNVLPTQTVQRWLADLVPTAAAPASWTALAWTLVCTLNGLALLAALVLMAWQAARIARPKAASSATSD